MPIFEFQCRDCGEKVERILRAPAAEVDCPHCGKAAKRIVSVVSVAGAEESGCAAPGGSGFS